MTEFRRPVPLDVDRHTRSGFNSGEPDLDEWLQRYAGQSRRGDTAATWVVTDQYGAVVAYVSTAVTGVDRSAAPSALAKGAPNPVPALLVGRLAVDLRCSGLGVGTSLVAHVLASAVEVNPVFAFRAVVVTSLHARACRWWERLGFRPFDPDDPDCMELYLLTSEIEATLDQIRNIP